MFIFLISGILLGSFFSLSDPDYFWHYKAGEYITENKSIPEKDIFSFSMPDFKWVNHEWLSDTILYNIEETFGQTSLSAFYLLLFSTLVGLIIFGKKREINPLDFFVGFIGFTLITLFSGVRQQAYSFLIFGILLFLIKEKEKKIFWLIPFLFLFWVNLHGGFALGIFVLTLFLIINLIKKTVKPQYFSVFFLSLAATFVNPYGVRVYEEVLRTIGDNYLTRHILEWQPVFFAGIDFKFPIYLAFFLAFLPKIFKKIPLEFKVLSVFLFLMSLKSIKYIPLFVLTTLPFFLEATNEYFTKENVEFIKKVIFSRKIIAVFAFYFLLIYLFFFVGSGISLKYPDDETVKIIKNDSETNIFNPYGWGGYLIRYAPEKKYFIDGRMPSWREGEQFAFRDYIDATSCKNTIPILNKYKIKTVLFEKREEKILENKFLSNVKNFFAVESNEEDKDKCDFIKLLKDNGWQVEHKNKNIIILKK